MPGFSSYEGCHFLPRRRTTRERRDAEGQEIRELVKKANAGCGEAAWAIARHYDNGSGGVEKNEALDVQWTEKSAALGYSLAQLVLGVRMRDKGDYTSARAWFEKSAAGGG